MARRHSRHVPVALSSLLLVIALRRDRPLPMAGSEWNFYDGAPCPVNGCPGAVNERPRRGEATWVCDEKPRLHHWPVVRES